MKCSWQSPCATCLGLLPSPKEKGSVHFLTNSFSTQSTVLPGNIPNQGVARKSHGEADPDHLVRFPARLPLQRPGSKGVQPQKSKPSNSVHALNNPLQTNNLPSMFSFITDLSPWCYNFIPSPLELSPAYKERLTLPCRTPAALPTRIRWLWLPCVRLNDPIH